MFVNIPDNAKIVAMKTRNEGRSGIGQSSGFAKGVLGDGTQTDSQWKCKLV